MVVSFFALIVTLLDKRLLFGFGGESFYGSIAMLLGKNQLSKTTDGKNS